MTVTVKDFATVGRQMRDRQKAYFKNRSRENLIEAKKSETAFDALISRAEIELSSKKPDDSAMMPSAGLLAKLGSVVIHAQEFMSKDAHGYDAMALRQLIDYDDDVQQWIAAMDKLAMIPKKRKP